MKIKNTIAALAIAFAVGLSVTAIADSNSTTNSPTLCVVRTVDGECAIAIASYRISANFLNWVSVNYDSNIVTEVNEDLREGKYTRDFWKRHTNKTAQELGEEWKKQMQAQLQRLKR